MKSLTILVLLYVVRVLRWVSLFQQKEYRLDRLWLFLRSDEGKTELLHILPRWVEFSRKGMRRPVLTVRSIALTGMLCAVPLLWFAVLAVLQLPAVLSVVYAGLGLVLAYLLVPFLLILLDLPITVGRELLTEILLYLAREKLRAGGATVIGITGSYGKTSTKLVLAAVLSEFESVFVTPKSFNTRLSVARSILSGYTNQKFAIIEYAAYTQNEIAQLAKWIQPALAIVTGVTAQHLGLFGSLAAIIRAKSELVQAVPANAAVFCQAEDEGAAQICSVRDDVRVIAYSGDAAAVRVQKPRLSEMGELSFYWQGTEIKTQLIGRHYLANVQAALAVVQELGVSTAQVKKGLESFVPTSSFIRVMRQKQGALLIDDGGTSNPKGFAVALELLANPWQGVTRRILLTGGIIDLGKDTETIHKQLAAAAQGCVNTVLYTGTTGIAAFQAAFGEQCISDMAAIENHIASLTAGDCLLIEGRLPKTLEKLLRTNV